MKRYRHTIETTTTNGEKQSWTLDWHRELTAADADEALRAVQGIEGAKFSGPIDAVKPTFVEFFDDGLDVTHKDAPQRPFSVS